MSKPETLKTDAPKTDAPKTDAPKTEPAQAHAAPRAEPAHAAPKAGFDPLWPFTFSADAVAQATREHLNRMQAAWAEYGAFEAALFDRARTSAADVAQLGQDGMTYATQLASEWRKIAIDSARRAVDAMALNR
jgi:hypothetical protein